MLEQDICGCARNVVRHHFIPITKAGKRGYMTVTICGVPHKVVECEDKFNVDTHFGQIDYKTCEIRINKDLTEENKKETICHEMVHGIFIHLGYNDYAQDEQLVQALGNAIYQGFSIKAESEDKE